MPASPMKFTRYCLAQWISKLPGSFKIHWVRQYLINEVLFQMNIKLKSNFYVEPLNIFLNFWHCNNVPYRPSQLSVFRREWTAIIALYWVMNMFLQVNLMQNYSDHNWIEDRCHIFFTLQHLWCQRVYACCIILKNQVICFHYYSPMKIKFP